MPRLHSIHHRDNDTAVLTSCEVFDLESDGSITILPRGAQPGLIVVLSQGLNRRAIVLDPMRARALRDHLIEFCDQLPAVTVKVPSTTG